MKRRIDSFSQSRCSGARPNLLPTVRSIPPPVSRPDAAELADQAMAELGRTQGSAAEGFAWGMKTRSAARLIGEPTAGVILSGETFDIAAGWRLTVPVAGLWSPTGENLGDKPVTPLETVRETRADLCAGRDGVAERAKAILIGN